MKGSGIDCGRARLTTARQPWSTRVAGLVGPRGLFLVSPSKELHLVVAAQKKTLNVRPKFFHLITDGIPPNLFPPNRQGGTHRPGPGMVDIRDACGGAATEDFREVELVFPRIRADDHNPQAGVFNTVKEASFAQLEVARILSQRRSEDGAYHKVLNGVVGKR